MGNNELTGAPKPKLVGCYGPSDKYAPAREGVQKLKRGSCSGARLPGDYAGNFRTKIAGVTLLRKFK